MSMWFCGRCACVPVHFLVRMGELVYIHSAGISLWVSFGSTSVNVPTWYRTVCKSLCFHNGPLCLVSKECIIPSDWITLFQSLLIIRMDLLKLWSSRCKNIVCALLIISRYPDLPWLNFSHCENRWMWHHLSFLLLWIKSPELLSAVLPNQGLS